MLHFVLHVLTNYANTHITVHLLPDLFRYAKSIEMQKKDHYSLNSYHMSWCAQMPWTKICNEFDCPKGSIPVLNYWQQNVLLKPKHH